MKRWSVVWGIGLPLLVVAALSGCHTRNVEGAEEPNMEGVIQDEQATNPNTASPFVEREFWLAIADEPGLHLSEARQRFLDGNSEGAAEDLVKVASMIKFETRHAHSPMEREKLLEAVDDLQELARQLKFEEAPAEGVPDVSALDEVEARTYEALAAHQIALSRESLDAGDALMAGRYIQQSTNDIEKGFALADVPPGATMKRDLSNARTLADTLVNEGNGERAAADDAIDRLQDAEHGLAEVLGSRRK